MKYIAILYRHFLYLSLFEGNCATSLCMISFIKEFINLYKCLYKVNGIEAKYFIGQHLTLGKVRYL